MGFNFYCDCTSPTTWLQLILCLWTWGIFFGMFQSPPVNSCSTASYDFGALAGGDERMSYSTILNWEPVDYYS